MTDIATRPDTTAEFHKQVEEQAGRHNLQRIKDGLSNLKQTRIRLQEEDQRAMNEIQDRMAKRERELYIIESRELAVRDAIRRLEDRGVL